MSSITEKIILTFLLLEAILKFNLVYIYSACVNHTLTRSWVQQHWIAIKFRPNKRLLFTGQRHKHQAVAPSTRSS